MKLKCTIWSINHTAENCNICGMPTNKSAFSVSRKKDFYSLQQAGILHYIKNAQFLLINLIGKKAI